MVQKKQFLTVAIVIGLILALPGVSSLVAQDAATVIRWDIINAPVNDEGKFVSVPGGSAFAKANNASVLTIAGSGTFNQDDRSMVTGGGTWNTVDWDLNPTGNGMFTVTELVSWELAEGELPAEFFADEIGDLEDNRAGVVVLRVAYSNEDGTPAGSGILIVGCRLIGTPFTTFEGIIATKGTDVFNETAEFLPGIDANLTAFHVVP